MKVVLFCGGTGFEYGKMENIPKPMLTVGYQPVIWHIMKYYAHFGHKDFILCLGHQAEMIKDFFMRYNASADTCIPTEVSYKADMLVSETSDWKITFMDTGIKASLGMRLLAVRDLLKGEEIFFSNYCDGLTDLYLPDMFNWFMEQKDTTAALMAYQPTQSLHIVDYQDDGVVKNINNIRDSGYYVNTGYLIFRQDVFDYLETGYEGLNEPFESLINENKVVSWEHKGFWAGMDIISDKQTLDEYYSIGKTPWEVWR